MSVVCSCRNETINNPDPYAPLIESVLIVHVVDPDCPVCGPKGRDRRWIDATTMSTPGPGEYVDAGLMTAVEIAEREREREHPRRTGPSDESIARARAWDDNASRLFYESSRRGWWMTPKGWVARWRFGRRRRAIRGIR